MLIKIDKVSVCLLEISTHPQENKKKVCVALNAIIQLYVVAKKFVVSQHNIYSISTVLTSSL